MAIDIHRISLQFFTTEEMAKKKPEKINQA